MAKLIDFNEAKKQRQDTSLGNRKLFLLAGLVAALVAVLAGILYLLGIQTVEVVGNSHYSEAEILKMAGIEGRANMLRLYFDKGSIAEEDAYIESMELEFSNFNRMRIVVREKEIIGYLPYMGKYLCVDREGRIIDYAERRDDGIPVIEGLTIHRFQEGELLGIDDAVLNNLYYLIRSISQLEVPIDKVSFNYEKDKDISLYSEDVEIKIGDVGELERKMATIKKVLEQMPPGERGIIDVRNLQSSIIFREYKKMSPEEVEAMEQP
ncbi:cell division protein FtsQ/DivIB [Anaerotalea alkaliphila]|uniref:FtsQ-type POTRA domain-containing protein n=1 Tax=Anaerotalea alkaliphila TaxID=2662126 RepID=A0A7X5HT43_9FIRM|nr:cell division protein FtsQ/DivIB [Anaerotalea alkaliphila]NDL66144.1 FtsQ-type POTRA domain-containing protein [Anaerotalea alkaliphila]